MMTTGAAVWIAGVAAAGASQVELIYYR